MNAHDADEPKFASDLLFTDGLPEMDDEVGYRGAVPPVRPAYII